MAFIYEEMVETSIHAALAAIEIYNKPYFKYREQTFTVLSVNAWELLLKAKILKEASDNITSLYIPNDKGGYKLNRSGNPLTIEIRFALTHLPLDTAIVENLSALVELRDTATHFYHSASISYFVYKLGVACLRNYQKLISDWFSRSLQEFNFFILPLAFAYNFKTLSSIELQNEPTVIANLLRAASITQNTLSDSGNFYFVCEFATQLKSAKKLTELPGFTAAVVTEEANPDANIIIRNLPVYAQYPVSYKKLREVVKANKPECNQNHLNSFIRNHDIKNNPRYSAYQFTSKESEDEYRNNKIVRAGTVSWYNEDAVRFLLENIENS
jgi:hypothetical protein